MGAQKQSIPKYQVVCNHFKKRIQKGYFLPGDYLPSEHAICAQFNVTRTTTRRALDALLNEGFITKERGKGSRVVERKNALGLLTVKGFSEVSGEKAETLVVEDTALDSWNDIPYFAPSSKEKDSECVSFSRLRNMEGNAVMVDKTWYSLDYLPLISAKDFVADSFFKTLSKQYLIEILGSDQELRSEPATASLAEQLNIKTGDPILHISIRFTTTKSGFYIYSEVYCNTKKYPISNSYFI